MSTKKIFLVAILSIACTSVQAQFKTEPNDGYRVDFSHINIIKPVIATSAFTAIKTLGIPYKYPQGGCESRAYLMGLLLDSMKISNFRIWLLAPPAFEQNANGALTIKDLNDPTNDINWTYHTAPALLVKSDNSIDTVIFDPAINSQKYLILRDWLIAIKGSEKARYYFVPNQYFGYYSTNNIMNGNFYKYEGNAYDIMFAEKNLALDYVGRYVYNMYLKKQGKKFDAARVNKLRPVVSNIYNFQQYILKNELPSGSGPERSFYEQSPDFIIDCKNVFNRELKKFHDRMINLQSL